MIYLSSVAVFTPPTSWVAENQHTFFVPGGFHFEITIRYLFHPPTQPNDFYLGSLGDPDPNESNPFWRIHIEQNFIF